MHMNLRLSYSSLLRSIILSILLGQRVLAADANETQTNPSYSPKGADTCLKCHDEDNVYPVMPIFKTKHGERNDPRSPMAKLQCETCHGPVGDHQIAVKKGEKKAPIRAFGSKAWTPIAEQNTVCLSCHNDLHRANWPGGPHEKENLACASCHVIHTRQDPMRDSQAQTEKCVSCHINQRAEFNRHSAHPIRYGKMRCTNCHNPHGSMSDNLLNSTSKNALCYTCHTEKRGPLLWTHAPVAEDCTLCHSPHGSLHPALLKKQPPLLCQSCHAASGHPSLALSANGLPAGTPSQFLLARSCLNCHSQVHGSNHPSGGKLLR